MSKMEKKWANDERMELAEFRRKKKLTQYDMADILGVTQGSISNVERGAVSDYAKTTCRMRNWKLRYDINSAIKAAVERMANGSHIHMVPNSGRYPW